MQKPREPAKGIDYDDYCGDGFVITSPSFASGKFHRLLLDAGFWMVTDQNKRPTQGFAVNARPAPPRPPRATATAVAILAPRPSGSLVGMLSPYPAEATWR